LQQTIKVNGLDEKVDELIIPTQEKIVMYRGKKKKIEERIFPGYILAHFVADDDVLHVIRNTEGVTGFVGSSITSKRPKALDEKEVKAILTYTTLKDEPVYEIKLTVGTPVRVVHGPFKDLVGQISSIDEAKGQIKVMLPLFGSDTPVSFDIIQVAAITD
jgi:transcriptional antiterminator NusG